MGVCRFQGHGLSRGFSATANTWASALRLKPDAQLNVSDFSTLKQKGLGEEPPSVLPEPPKAILILTGRGTTQTQGLIVQHAPPVGTSTGAPDGWEAAFSV